MFSNDLPRFRVFPGANLQGGSDARFHRWLVVGEAVLAPACGGGSSGPAPIPDVRDHSFGPGGIVRCRGLKDAVVTAIALQPDGKIVVCGYSGEPGVTPFVITVGRYTAAGALDATFGTGGIAQLPSATRATCIDVPTAAFW